MATTGTLITTTGSVEWPLFRDFRMKTHKNLYPQIFNMSNLILAWREARKRKTKKPYVMEFEKDLVKNLLNMYYELKAQTYFHKPLTTFILRDPKTRKISKSEFIDRIAHHALVRVLEPIFDPTFIYDSCANRKGKGNLFAIKRLQTFLKKVSRNGQVFPNDFNDSNYIKSYCLKADIKHYFQEVNHEILLKIIKRKIADKQVIWLIKRILNSGERERDGQLSYYLDKKGMSLGNLTSQFFANVYLNELDYFIKHDLRAKYYIRYVDDFVILHSSKSQLKIWKQDINNFLIEKLKIELHPEKSRIIALSRGVDFVGFRNFYYFKLLRRRNIKKMEHKILSFNKGKMNYEKLIDSFQGWEAYAMWANSEKIIKKVLKKIKL